MEEIEKPRKLTEDEIKDILSVIPYIKSAADNVSENNTKSLKVLFTEQLKDIEITPVGISDLKSEIIRQFDETVIRPGEMVGPSSSESLGKNTTQAALNSFHSSGSSKNVSKGVDRIKELIHASETKKQSTTIYFKNEFLSFDDIIIQKRPEITNITVQKLVRSADTVSYNDFVEPEWYDLFRKMFRKDFKSNYVLRLDIDVNMLYAYKLTMEDICSVIEDGGSVICVYSPMSIGKIDIYPIERLIDSILTEKGFNGISSENSSLVFLSTVITSYLDSLIISGIPGIQQIYPVESPVLQILKEEQKDEKHENIWYLILNPVRMKISGISENKIVKLCELAGIKVVKIRPNYIGVESETSPTKIIKDMIEKDEKEQKEYEKIRKEKSLPSKPLSEVSIHSKLVYADTTGTNFTELLGRSDVDTTRSFCNDVHKIKEVFGIEAARNFLIKEYGDVFGDEGYINPRHIVLLADYQTNLGILSGVTFSGVSKQDVSALAKASYQHAMDVFEKAAGFGEEKSVSGTSDSIYVGKKALVGTGYSENYIKPENLERYNETRAELMKNPNLTIDANAFNEQIEMFDLGGEELDLLENTKKMMFLAPMKFTEKEPVSPKDSDVDISQYKKNYIFKGETTRSSEFEEAAKELEDKLLKSVTCSEIKVPEVEITSGGITKFKLPGLTPMPFPAPKPVKTFNLEDFLK